MKTNLLILVVSLTAFTGVFAVKPSQGGGYPMEPDQETTAADGSVIIFSNLGQTPDTRYNSNSFAAFTVAGKKASGSTEVLQAIAFTPKVDVQATVLFAAIGYSSGTKLVNLGIYSDNGSGTVGTLLPGGQGQYH